MLRMRTFAFALVASCAFLHDAAAQALTPRSVLWYETIPASGPATSHTYLPGADTFDLAVGNDSQFTLRINPAQFALPGFAEVDFGPISGQAFALGPAEVAQNYFGFGNPARPYLNANVGDSLCSVDSGRFVVLDLGYDSSLVISRFAADFEGHCSDGRTTYGEVRFQSSVPLTMEKPADAATPDAFAFIPRGDVGPGALVTSSVTTIYGIRAGSPTSITGGEYSVNGGPYTAAPGIVVNRDHVTVRTVAPAAYGATATATLTVGGVSASFEATTYIPGVPFTATAVEQDALLSSNPETRIEARPPEWNITTSSGSPPLVINATGPANTALTFRLGPGSGRALLPGVYEDARSAGNGISPLLQLSAGSCAATSGRFVIHELERSADGKLVRLAASLSQWCASSPPVFAEVRINSAMPLRSMVTAPLSTPYPFALSAESPVPGGTLVRSNLVSIDGVNQTVPLSIVGGEYSLNGGAYTSLPGVAHLHDDVRVQLTASRTPGVVTSATLFAGGQSATLSVTTYRTGMSLTGLQVQSADGDPIGGGGTRLFLAPPNSFAINGTRAQGVFASLAGLGSDIWFARLLPSPNATLDAGTYEGARRVRSGTEPILDVSGNGASCNQVFGRFVVREAVYAANGAPQRFAADLEQHCESPTAPPLLAEVRFNSTVPFSALAANACTAGDPACTADLVVTQSGPAAPIMARDMVLTLNVTNNGPSDAHDVTLTDTLPGNVQVVSAPAGCSVAGSTLRCVNASLAGGGTLSYDVVLRPSSPGPVVSAVSVAADEFDTIPANNDTTLTVQVAAPPHMSNISTRGQVLVGNDVMIGGFVIGGSTSKTVVVTAVGPSLAAAGIGNALADPTLTLVRSADNAILAANDDWSSAPNASAIEAAGFAPGNPRESAIMMTLPPGAYTAIVQGAGNTAGVGIVAVYEVDHPEVPLVNISTRGRVSGGNDVMIGGFVVQGAAPQTVVVTGIGPSLIGAGIPDALANPALTLVRSSDGAVIAANDDWGTAPNAGLIQAAGLAPGHAAESAIMVTLDPGAYTAILSGGGATGVGIIAVYSVP